MSPTINRNSLRAKKARAGAHISDTLWRLTLMIVFTLGLSSLALLISSSTRNFGFAWIGASIIFLCVVLWYRYDLKDLPAKQSPKTLDDVLEPHLMAELTKPSVLSAESLLNGIFSTWQGRFMANHLGIDRQNLTELIDVSESGLNLLWQSTIKLMELASAKQIDGANLFCSIIISSKSAKQFLASRKLDEKELISVYQWCERLGSFLDEPKPRFGGIGRDWAAGFTPTLDKFGENISKTIEAGRGHFHTLAHSDVLDGAIHNLSQGGGVALVGETGSGKTGLAYALAQRLLEGRDEALRYYQLISLNASAILSASSGELEKIMLTLFAEASHAGNIIIFLDEGQLFFGKGTGAFDIGKILLPLMQNRSVKIVAAFTPNDYQRLKSSNESLISQLGIINISEPGPELTMSILEDTALTIEANNGLLVTFAAVREAMRLSQQYVSELAYPGKAISLLEQAIAYAEGKVLSDISVQQAIEKTRGVKVSKASGAETEVLLNLEEKIHQRMINQKQAVNVIAAALRRGRAGVANPKRPTGSFLFLGPTGVGKTELARSLAAVYFGDEKQMIRLDMSEYQQPDDVARLLDGGGDAAQSLMLSIREQPFSVVLLDEIEKAHPNILNLLLQLLDEGQLTDQSGKSASFKNAIIICTSNAGSADIIARVGAGDSLDNFERPLIEKLMAAGQFKPELVNRFDEIVLFRPLNQEELSQVAQLMLAEVNKTLSNQNVSVELTPAALSKIVSEGYDPEFGARPMRRVIQKMVENSVAKKILAGQADAGTIIKLDVNDLSSD